MSWVLFGCLAGTLMVLAIPYAINRMDNAVVAIGFLIAFGGCLWISLIAFQENPQQGLWSLFSVWTFQAYIARRTKKSATARRVWLGGMMVIVLGGLLKLAGLVIGPWELPTWTAAPVIVAPAGRPAGAPPAAVLARPPSEEEVIAQALEDLRAGRAHGALMRLAATKPTGPRAEVAKAVEPLVQDANPSVRLPAVEVLRAWGAAENVPTLLGALHDSNVLVRQGAIKGLGRIKDERAIEPLAELLSDFSVRGEASRALQGFGAAAESAVWPFLQDKDFFLRTEACAILQAIGTKKSAAELRKAMNDPSIKFHAEQALQAASRRR
jgi:HEAT repeat protein